MLMHDEDFFMFGDGTAQQVRGLALGCAVDVLDLPSCEKDSCPHGRKGCRVGQARKFPPVFGTIQ